MSRRVQDLLHSSYCRMMDRKGLGRQWFARLVDKETMEFDAGDCVRRWDLGLMNRVVDEVNSG